MIDATLSSPLLLLFFAARFSSPFVAIFQPAPSRSRRTNTIMENDSVELRLRRNAPRIDFLLLAIAAGCEVSRRLLAFVPDHIVVRVVIALAIGVRNWCVIMAMVVGIFWGTAVVTGALNRRFPSTSRRTSSVVLVGLLGIVAVACFFFVPFCLGSLKDGTYDCITLARRVQSALAGG